MDQFFPVVSVLKLNIAGESENESRSRPETVPCQKDAMKSCVRNSCNAGRIFDSCGIFVWLLLLVTKVILTRAILLANTIICLLTLLVLSRIAALLIGWANFWDEQ